MVTRYSDTFNNTNFRPLLIWTVLPNLTFYLIVRGFHRTFETGTACQQRTLTPPNTWSGRTLGLVCVLMSRPTSPELVLFPDFLSVEHPSVLLFVFFFLPFHRKYISYYAGYTITNNRYHWHNLLI